MIKNLLTCMVLLVCSIIFGCNSSYRSQTSLDKNWGRSFETARFNQILNPDAPDNTDPVTGLHGVAAMNSFDQYQNSFKTNQTPQPVLNINLSN